MVCGHDRCSRSAVVIYGHSLRSWSALTYLQSRSVFTIYGHSLRSRSAVTICGHSLRSRSTTNLRYLPSKSALSICAHDLRSCTICVHARSAFMHVLRSRFMLTACGHVTVCAHDIRSQSALTIYCHSLSCMCSRSLQ